MDQDNRSRTVGECGSKDFTGVHGRMGECALRYRVTPDNLTGPVERECDEIFLFSHKEIGSHHQDIRRA